VADPVIQLKPDQSADPCTCGSCEMFRRYDGAGGGVGTCMLVLPPAVQVRQRPEKYDEDFEPGRTYDFKTCSFYRPLRATYTKQITWQVHGSEVAKAVGVLLLAVLLCGCQGSSRMYDATHCGTVPCVEFKVSP
jgi:hypothetical protein